jgi:hypothetical protein
MVRILKFRFHKENGIMVIPHFGGENIGVDRAVPSKPWILLFRKLRCMTG